MTEADRILIALITFGACAACTAAALHLRLRFPALLAIAGVLCVGIGTAIEFPRDFAPITNLGGLLIGFGGAGYFLGWGRRGS